MDGGEIVARVLGEEKVSTVFTLCGGHVSPILVAAKRANIRVTDTRHEASAVFAADATARLTGIPGVAVVTAGPGISNSITALHNAFMAQSPVVLLGGSAPTFLKGRGALQDIDQMSVVRSSVKWARAIRKRKDIYPAIREAFQAAREGVPGPVFVELPVDLLYDESIVRDWYRQSMPKSDSLRSRLVRWYMNRHLNALFKGELKFNYYSEQAKNVAVTQGNLNMVLSKLGASHRPVMVIGSGTMTNPSLVNDLAEAIGKLGVPVYLSGMARGLLGVNHPLQFRHHRKDALREADLVILAGVPSDFRLEYGNHINRNALLIGLNLSKSDLNKNRKPDIGFVTDPARFLILLSHGSIEQNTSSWEEWMQLLREREADRNTSILEQAQNNQQGINPLQLFIKLNNQLPENALIVADGGDFVGTASYTLNPRAPLSWLDPGVFGTLGIGGGFAIGAKVTRPDAEVYIIYGDGSSGYSLMEIDTCVRHKLPVIAIIGNDACWTQIARDQVEILKDDCGTSLATSEYELVAIGLGARGRKVRTIAEFEAALADARKSVQEGLPYVINAVLAPSEFRKGSLSM